MAPAGRVGRWLTSLAAVARRDLVLGDQLLCGGPSRSAAAAALGLRVGRRAVGTAVHLGPLSSPAPPRQTRATCCTSDTICSPEASARRSLLLAIARARRAHLAQRMIRRWSGRGRRDSFWWSKAAHALARPLNRPMLAAGNMAK